MRAAAVLAIVAVLSLAILVGGPTSLAQGDPEAMPPGDQETPAAACVPAADAPAPDQPGPSDAAPICTPVPGSDVAPPDPAGGTSGPGPTDTPVPADTPRPTDTPQAASPTNTPTPVPLPTDTPTPTPTSAAKDVPVGTLARQLPFANPGDDECVFDLTIKSDTQSCNPQSFPALFTINFSPFSSDAPIKLQVDGRKPQTITSDTFDFLSVPGGPGPDTHKIAASETFVGTPLSASLSLPVQKANGPHFLVYPRHMRPGTGGKIYLAGFPADTVVPLGVYRERQDCNTFGQGQECYELARDLGATKINSDGTAIREFSIPPKETPTAYLIATPGLNLASKDVSVALKALGRPWFVVDQP